MSLSLTRYTIVRFRTNHGSFSFAITNFHSISRLIFLFKNVDVGFSALIFRESSIRSFVKDGFFEEVKASCLSIRYGQVSITSVMRRIFLRKQSLCSNCYDTHLSSLVKPYPLKKIGLSVKSLSDKSPIEEMSESEALGGNAISLHCLKLVLTSFGLDNFAGM